MESKDVG